MLPGALALSCIRAFEDGATPETINQQYPTTSLADLYSARHWPTANNARVRN
jgi:uncharacterized protein (DUF433 family)